jgi:hypothetical protein
MNSVLNDLELFTDQSDWSLVDWLLAIKNKAVAFDPKYCAVRIDHEWLNVVNGGVLSPDIDTVIDKVKSLPTEYRNFPNDYTEIKADVFERELFFNTHYVAKRQYKSIENTLFRVSPKQFLSIFTDFLSVYA